MCRRNRMRTLELTGQEHAANTSHVGMNVARRVALHRDENDPHPRVAGR